MKNLSRQKPFRPGRQMIRDCASVQSLFFRRFGTLPSTSFKRNSLTMEPYHIGSDDRYILHDNDTNHTSPTALEGNASHSDPEPHDKIPQIKVEEESKGEAEKGNIFQEDETNHTPPTALEGNASQSQPEPHDEIPKIQVEEKSKGDAEKGNISQDDETNHPPLEGNTSQSVTKPLDETPKVKIEEESKSDAEKGDVSDQKTHEGSSVELPEHDDQSPTNDILQRIDRLLGLPTEGLDSFSGDEAKFGDSVLSLSQLSTSSIGLGVDTKFRNSDGPPLLISPFDVRPRRSSGSMLSKEYFDSNYEKESVLSSVGAHSVGSDNRPEKVSPLYMPPTFPVTTNGSSTESGSNETKPKEKRRFSETAKAAIIVGVVMLLTSLVLVCIAMASSVTSDDNHDTVVESNDHEDFWKVYNDQTSNSK